MYTYVCMYMREGLVTARIDTYESGPTSARTLKGHADFRE